MKFTEETRMAGLKASHTNRGIALAIILTAEPEQAGADTWGVVGATLGARDEMATTCQQGRQKLS